jgi:hypothetical protein
MKKLVVLLILALIGVYGVGRFNLGEAGAMRFMTNMEMLMSEGKTEEVCAMFHDDLEVDISDHSGESTHTVNGGKKEFCDLTTQVVAGLQMLPHSSNVEYTDIAAKQDLTKPWTGEVSYSEHRTFSIQGAGASILTVSEDEITLVQTFSGVKLRKLKSEVFKAEAT